MKRTTAALALLFCAWSVAPAIAAPITITQTFGPSLDSFLVNGSLQVVTGDWIFTILTDTSNPDLQPNPTVGVFATSAITLSNSGLGLVNVNVLAPYSYYYEAALGDVVSGFSDLSITYGVQLAGTAVGALGAPNLIEPGFLTFTANIERIFAFGVPLVLSNGTTIEGGSNPSSGSQSGLAAAAVPEPTSLLLLGTGLVAAGARRFRRRQQ